MTRKTNEQFISDLFGIYGDEYTPLDEYVTAKTKIRVRHNVCGNVWKVQPTNLYTKGCPECARKRVADAGRRTQSEFETLVFELVGEEFVVTGEYINSQTKVEMFHRGCNEHIEVIPNNFTRGQRCRCDALERRSKSQRGTHEKFLERLDGLLEDEFEIVGRYSTYHGDISVLHKTCGMVFESTPARLFEGKRCGHCRSSKGERKIRQWLVSYGVDFIEEYTDFEDSEVGTLRFDFAILGADGEVVSLIEYNGIQHYEPVPHFGGVVKFNRQVEYDNKKLEYAKRKQLPLLVIKYDEDVLEVLSKLIPR